ncbi:MAG: hypothetical protein ACK42Y_07055 [Candidatus Thermochlorobacter sp.]
MLLLQKYPDCGLKTCKWEETKDTLQNVVCAAQYMRNVGTEIKA